MGTTSITQSVLETDILVQTLTVSSAEILDNQWQVCCVLIPSDLVATYFQTPGDINVGEFAILSRNTYTTIVQNALLEGANTFYNQSSNATLGYIVFEAPADWGAVTPAEMQAFLQPVLETIKDRTNITVMGIEDSGHYVTAQDAVDVLIQGLDIYGLRIEPVPADAAGVDTLSSYMQSNPHTSTVLNNTYTLDGRPDFGGAAGGLQTLGDLATGHTWQGNPVVGVAPTFIEPSGTLLQAIKDSPLSFTQRETPDSDTIVYMGGWAYGGYTSRTPLSYLIFNIYSRIQLRNNILPLITRREERPVTSDDVNSVSSIMSAILEPYVNKIIQVNTLIIKSYTPTEIQQAIQSGTLILVLNEMITYTLPRVTQAVNVTIVAEAA